MLEHALPATRELLESSVRTGRVVGIVGAFGAAGQPTRFIAAGRIGERPDAPAPDPNTLWRIYSMSKPVTGIAAMMLVEDGKLRLDQPVHEILPAFRSMRVLTAPDKSLASRPATKPITIRHLLTHTSGLSYDFASEGPIRQEYQRLGILPYAFDPKSEAQARRARPTSLQGFADRVATLPLVHEPGAKWTYSIGLDVLAAVIERASGMPYERFLQTRLMAPLGMTSTVFTVPRSEAGRLATNFTRVEGKLIPIDAAATSMYLEPPSFAYGGAGLVSSARDYDRFLHMLQNGGELDGVRVMKSATARQAMSNLLPPGVIYDMARNGTGASQRSDPAGYGAGGVVHLSDRPGGPGKGSFGWGGAAGTTAFVNPARGVRVTLMLNNLPAEGSPSAEEVAAAIARDLGR